AKGAQARGATVVEHVRVLAVLQRQGRAVGVEVAPSSAHSETAPHPPFGHPLPLGGGEGRGEGAAPSTTIHAEYIVLTGGMWTRELGLRCGVTIPLYPVEHHYVVTEPIDGAFDELPVGRDPDLCLYFRGEGNAVMLGAFQA